MDGYIQTTLVLFVVGEIENLTKNQERIIKLQ
jgi:hypothetical protein